MQPIRHVVLRLRSAAVRNDNAITIRQAEFVSASHLLLVAPLDCARDDKKKLLRPSDVEHLPDGNDIVA